MPKRPEHYGFFIMTVVLLFTIITRQNDAIIFGALLGWGFLAVLSASLSDDGGG